MTMGVTVSIILNKKDETDTFQEDKKQILDSILGSKFTSEFYEDLAESYHWYVFDDSQYFKQTGNGIEIVICQYDDYDYGGPNWEKIVKNVKKSAEPWIEKLETDIGNKYTVSIEESNY